MNTEPQLGVGVEPRRESIDSIEREIGVLLRRIKLHFEEQGCAVHPELHSGAYFLLAWLNAHGPVRASVISDTFMLDKGAVSRRISMLEELGLVERLPDPADGRATLISVSVAGKERMVLADEHRREWFDTRVASMTVEELESLATLLARFNEAMQ